jgi:hypothetical protein
MSITREMQTTAIENHVNDYQTFRSGMLSSILAWKLKKLENVRVNLDFVQSRSLENGLPREKKLGNIGGEETERNLKYVITSRTREEMDGVSLYM